MSTVEIWQNLQTEYRPKVRYWIPAAAVDEADLREELRQLAARGFGGVEVMTLATVSPDIATGEDGWGTENWDRVVDIIADETQKLGISMDIANGPGWPISMPGVRSADDEAALHELAYGVAEAVPGTRYRGPLPLPRITHDEGRVELYHALAYLQTGEKILSQSSYIDLMPYVREGKLDYAFPEGNGMWTIFAFYFQPAVHKTNSGQYYVVDHLSQAGVKACEEYWNRIFANKNYPSMESFFCDSLEYNVSLDWTAEFESEFEKRQGYSIRPYLPFIGLEGMYPPCDVPGYRLEETGFSDMINHDYLETITQLYCENHLQGLERMAEKYGKTVRYQVAYNKPFEVERCGLYVSFPENEALGRPAIDALKTMAAAAHLGRKKRYSFECAAEFGHSYGQDYEDLFWWVKRSLMAGMNAQVLHGASYSGGYHGKCSVNGNLPGSQWPGYEGFWKLVSNYWNRTPDIDHARGCLDAITRLNTVFRKTAKVDCAILRASYLNDGLISELGFYDDGGKLSNLGYSYETISPALLSHPNCVVADGLLDKDGAAYQALIIPETNEVSVDLLRRVKELAQAGFPVIWIGEKPLRSFFLADYRTEEQQDRWRQALEDVWEIVAHVPSKAEVPSKLSDLGIRARVSLPDAAMDMITAVHQDGEQQYYALYGYNRVIYAPGDPNHSETGVSAQFRQGTTKGTYVRPGASSRKRNRVLLHGKGDVYACNYWNGTKEPLSFVYDAKADAMTGWVELEEDELVILLMGSELTCRAPAVPVEKASLAVKLDKLELRSFEPKAEGEISFLRSDFSDEVLSIKLDELKPWRMLDESLSRFAGKGTYYGSISVPELLPDAHYCLCLGNVCDTFEVAVNGEKADFPDQVMKRVDITNLLKSGVNELAVTVVSNLYNKVVTEESVIPQIPLKIIPRDYGIWETSEKKLEVKITQTAL